jgi:hypothetical protein
VGHTRGVNLARGTGDATALAGKRSIRFKAILKKLVEA